MRTLLCPLLLFTAWLTACQPVEPRAGNGVPAERQWPAPAVRRLVVAGPVSVRVLVGPGFEPSLRVEGDANLIGALRREVEGQTLSLDATGLSPAVPLHVTVTTGGLTAVSASDGAVVTTNGLRGGRLSLEAKAGARVLANGVDGDWLVVDARGGGTVDAAGVVRAVEASAADVGAVTLGALAARVALVKATELSSVTVTAAEAVRGSATRSSRLELRGEPRLRSVTVDESSTLELPARSDARAQSSRRIPRPG